MIMNYRTAILATFVCGSFLCVVLTMFLVGSRIPEQAELAAVAGRVSSVETITPKTNNIVFQLDSTPSTFKYTESLPNFLAVRRRVTAGRGITVYVDKGSADKASDVTVWGIETQGNSWLVTYEALVEYRRSNRRIGLILLPIFLLLTGAAAVAVWHEFRPRKSEKESV